MSINWFATSSYYYLLSTINPVIATSHDIILIVLRHSSHAHQDENVFFNSILSSTATNSNYHVGKLPISP